MFGSERPGWQRYLSSALAILLAIGVRALIDPLLGDRFAFVTVMIAAVFAYWYGGRGPALLALALSLLAADYLFVPPRYSLLIGYSIDQFGLFVYAALGGGLIVLGEVVRQAYQRSETSKLELLAAKQRLEQEAAHLQQSQQRLQESEERYRLVNRATNDVIWDWDLTTHELLWNDSAEAMLGYSLDEIPPTIDWWCDNIHPEDRDRVVTGIHAIIEGDTNGWINEYRFRRKDGAYASVLDRAYIYRNEQGVPLHMIGSMLDLTERKGTEEALRASEERFRQLADAMPQLVWTADPEGTVDYYNSRSREFEGISPEAEGRWQWAPALHPEDHQRTVEVWQHALRTGETYQIEHRVRGADGAYRWHLSRAVPARDSEGRIVKWFGTATDVHHQKQAEQAAEAANEAKSRFLANISHELRTPMNAILGMTELALDEPLSDTVRDYLETAKGAADTLLLLLNEILDFSRIESGWFELEPAPFQLRETLEATRKTMAVRARQKGLELSCDLPDDIPDALIGDALRLRQILVNLVGNAIKFTERGHVAVRVQMATQTAEEVMLQFAVEDTGIGIAPENIERIFSPFVQADSSTTRRHGGTGLGLPISASLVQLMGGRIWVDSTPGRGSRFVFTVQLGRQPVLSEPSKPLASGVIDWDGPAPRTLRVLLAEDTRANQKLVTYLLDRRGHTVEIAQNGQEAVDLIRQRPFDLVLMDVQMPVMDGFQATAAIRALKEPTKAEIPIVAMTAHAMRGDQQRCLAAGMDGYLAKPVNGRELIELVEHLPANK